MVARFEGRQRPVPGQVVQGDVPLVGAVAERVPDRAGPHVPHGALVDDRLHQVTPSDRAAVTPERQPSSWKPHPWYAPAKAVRPSLSSASPAWAATEDGV